MKNLSIAALLILCLFAQVPAQAAGDWDNGTFSCTVIIESQTPWYLPWQWGRWERFYLTYSISKSPDYRIAPYRCSYGAGTFGGIFQDRYDCVFTGTYRHFDDPQQFFRIELKPGASKSDVCGIVFNQLRLYPGNHY